MARNFLEEATREGARRDAFSLWIRARIELIKRAVSAHDVLRRHGIRLKQSSDDREEQFSCPFHGSGDATPSARVYPQSTSGPSHAWCYVCQEKGWDAIGLWRKFSGSTVKFTRILAEIERAYGIIPPETSSIPDEDFEDPELVEVNALLDICERRLKGAMPVFDMHSYLVIGSILDRLHYQVDLGTLPLPRAKEVLQQVLDKIGQRVRECPAA